MEFTMYPKHSSYYLSYYWYAINQSSSYSFTKQQTECCWADI